MNAARPGSGAILLKCAGPLPAPDTLIGALETVAGNFVPRATAIAGHAAIEGNETYLYLFSEDIRPTAGEVARRVAEGLVSLPHWADVRVLISGLESVFDVPGASRAANALFHYVVETDVVPEHEADLNIWYDTEHMPGLAAVPGSVRARRYRNPTGSPRYHSAYDLERTEILGCERWLAVRHTEWSDRVRPHFRNTRRTMFRKLFQKPL
jgi:hypothetical protein